MFSAGVSQCNRDRQQALAWAENFGVGVFSPECTDRGHYKQLQCHSATGYCWCVDSHGNELYGTRRRGKLDCSGTGWFESGCLKLVAINVAY